MLSAGKRLGELAMAGSDLDATTDPIAAEPIVPTVGELQQRTLEMIAAGIGEVTSMRRQIAQQLGLERGSPNWAAFVNNHAWALVRLQEYYRIRKVSRGHYALEPGIIVKPGTAISAVQQNGSLAQWAENLRRRANSVNRAAGLSEVITVADMIQLWKRCKGLCSLTGLGFAETIVDTGRAKRAFAPSLDRIDPEGPYSLDNCRLVLAAVNFALNRFGIETFDQIVVGRARTRRWLRRDALRHTPKEQAAPSDPLQG